MTPAERDQTAEIRTVLARIAKHGDLFAGVLRGTKKLPPV